MLDIYLEFVYKYRSCKFYQPIILEPDIIEIQGSWNDATKDLAEMLLFDIEGKSVLDVGCNVGFFLHSAWRKGASRVVGIDNDPNVIKVAKELSILLNIPIILHCLDENLYEEKTKFEVVLMLNVLDFIQAPSECIKKYLALTSEKLIIEHEHNHISYFPYSPVCQKSSPRSGGRLLSFFTPQ